MKMRWWSVVAVVVAFSGACSSGESRPAPSSTPQAESTVTQTASATASADPAWPVLQLGEPIELGPGTGQLDVTLYVEQGCTGCDGPPTAIERVGRDEAGVLRRERVFAAPAGSRYMTSTAMGVDGRLFATVCFGECAEVGSSIRSGYSALFSSTDNGETWARMDFPGESVKVVSLLLSGQPLLRVAQVDSTEASFEIWPSGELFVPPGPGYWPWATQNRQLPVLWENWTTGARVFPDGTTADIPARGAAGPDGLPRLVGVQPPRGWIVNWFVREPGFDGYQRLLGADYAGGVRWQFKVPSAVGAIIPVRWLSETRGIAWMNYEAPVLIDLDAGTVREIVIGDPLDEFGGRNKPVGIKPRP